MIVCEKPIDDAISMELEEACKVHGERFNSLHEAYAVIKEELEEAEEELQRCKRKLEDVWSDVRKNNTEDALYDLLSIEAAAKNTATECCQVAAMAEKALRCNGCTG